MCYVKLLSLLSLSSLYNISKYFLFPYVYLVENYYESNLILLCLNFPRFFYASTIFSFYMKPEIQCDEVKSHLFDL